MEINLEVLVDQIVMKDLLVSLMIKMTLIWKDNRLTYLNLRANNYQVFRQLMDYIVKLRSLDTRGSQQH